MQTPNTKIKPSPLDQKFNEALIEKIPSIIDPVKAGQTSYLSNSDLGIDKYATYGSKIYGKLGFKPINVKGQKTSDEIYNDSNNVGSLDLLRLRTLPGVGKLAGIGVKDTFGLNLLSDSDNYLKFDDVMKNYSSSKKGLVGWLHNTALSSGYTVGIIGGLALEELAIFGATAAAAPETLGTSIIPGAAAAGTALFRGLKLLNKVPGLKAIDALADVEKVRKMGWVKRGLTGFGKSLLPFNNVATFIRTADKFKKASNAKIVMSGVGAVVRDARKFALTHSESKLESDLARKEFSEKAYDNFYKINGYNTPISNAALKKIENAANNVYASTYKANFGLIYLTNAVTFDNVMRGMKSANKFFKNINTVGRFTVRGLKKGVNKTTVQAASSNIFKYIGRSAQKKLQWVTPKNVISAVVRNNMEGFQEIGQDVISNTSQIYYGKKLNKDLINLKKSKYNIYSKQIKGGEYNDLWNSFKTSVVGDGKKNSDNKGIFTWEGLGTYASGFFMGAFASPAGMITGSVTNFVTNQNDNVFSRKGVAKFIKNRKQFKIDRTKYKENLVKKAEQLEAIFNESQTFLSTFDRPLHEQAELQEQMLDAAAEGNTKDFYDAKHDSFTLGMYALLEAGIESEFSNNLRYMAKNFTAQELSDIFENADVNENNIDEYKNKLNEKADAVDNLRDVYDAVQVKYPIGVQLPNDNTDPEFLSKYIQHKAYKDLQKELVFSYSNIENRAERIEKVKNDLAEISTMNNLEINALSNSKDLDLVLKILDSEIQATEEMSPEKGTDVYANLENLKKRKKAYLDYSKATVKDGKVQADEKLYGAFLEIFDTFEKKQPTLKSLEAEETNTLSRREQAFEKVKDVLALGKDNEYYQKFVDTLLDPEGKDNYLSALEQAYENIDKNKGNIIYDSLLAFEQRKISNLMLDELYENGLFFNLAEIDDLILNNKMPSNIYNVETNKEATNEEYQLAVAIIEKHHKKLSNKKITNSKSQFGSGKKLTSDKRKLSTLINKYKIKIGEVLDLNSDKGVAFLNALLKNNKNLLYADKFLIETTLDNFENIQLKFVTNNELPVNITEDGVIELDIRFASFDYSNANMSFENLITSGIVQKGIVANLENNEKLAKEIDELMELAKTAMIEKYKNPNLKDLDFFKSREAFLTAALNDAQLQKTLSEFESDKSETLWKDFTKNISSLLEIDYEGRLINKVFNVAISALSKKNIKEVKKVDEVKLNEELDKTPEQIEQENKESAAIEESRLQAIKDLEDKEKLLSDLETEEKQLKIELDRLNNESTDTKADIERKVNSLPDNLLFITHVTSEGAALKIFNDNLLMPAGVSSTTGIVSKEQLKKLLFDLADGKSPQRGYLDLFIAGIDRSILENTNGRTLQDKLENYLDENFIEDVAKTQLPSSLNIGYFTNGVLNTKYDAKPDTTAEEIENVEAKLKEIENKIDTTIDDIKKINVVITQTEEVSLDNTEEEEEELYEDEKSKEIEENELVEKSENKTKTIQSLTKELNELKNQLEEKGTDTLTLEIADLQKEINDKVAEIAKLKTELQDTKSETEIETIGIDFINDNLINSELTWDQLVENTEFYKEVLKLYGKSSKEITEKDAINILNNLNTKPEYIALVDKYNELINNPELAKEKEDKEDKEKLPDEENKEEELRKPVNLNSGKTNELTEIDPFEEDAYIKTDLGKKINDFNKTLFYKSSSEIFDILKPKFDIIGKNVNTFSLVELLETAFMLKHAVTDNMTSPQKDALNNNVALLFEKMGKKFKGHGFKINGKLYIINNVDIYNTPRSNIKFTLNSISDNNDVIDYFLDNSNQVESIHAPETTVVINEINTEISKNKFEILIDSYKNTIENFSTFVINEESLSDEQLKEELKTELNKCK
jgi:hypothetical protein